MEENLYYIHVNGLQKGPFTIEQLSAEGITPDTMVWRAGMQQWAAASTLPELYVIFQAPPVNPGPTYQGVPHQQPNPYGPQYAPGSQMPNGSFPGSYPPGWTNWLGWAIAGTVLGFFTCCIGMIFGIIGIVKANQANSMARVGDPMAQAVNNTARTWTIVALILGGLGILGSLIAFIFGLWDLAMISSIYSL